MKNVWKCDFCSTTDVDQQIIVVHEDKCVFNKKNRGCYTCDHFYDDGYAGDSHPSCTLKLMKRMGHRESNCDGWMYEYLQRDRDNSLSDLGI